MTSTNIYRQKRSPKNLLCSSVLKGKPRTPRRRNTRRDRHLRTSFLPPSPTPPFSLSSSSRPTSVGLRTGTDRRHESTGRRPTLPTGPTSPTPPPSCPVPFSSDQLRCVETGEGRRTSGRNSRAPNPCSVACPHDQVPPRRTVGLDRLDPRPGATRVGVQCGRDQSPKLRFLR